MLMLLEQTDLVGAAGRVVDAGARDSTLLVLLVLAVIGFVGFVLHMKYYRPSRIEELKLKEKIENHRATQTVSLHGMANDLAAAATNLRESLKLTHKHLDRSCPGGMVRVDMGGHGAHVAGGENPR